MSFKEVNNIDVRTRYTVYGWIRRQEQELEIENMPPILAVIIILYFRNPEIFDII